MKRAIIALLSTTGLVAPLAVGASGDLGANLRPGPTYCRPVALVSALGDGAVCVRIKPPIPGPRRPRML